MTQTTVRSPTADSGPERAYDYPLEWRVKVIRPEWFRRRCRIVVGAGVASYPDGRRRRSGNRLIEFDDGLRVVCPGTYLRRARG